MKNTLPVYKTAKNVLEVLPNTIVMRLSSIYDGVRVLDVKGKKQTRSAAEHNKIVLKRLKQSATKSVDVL